MYTIADSVVSKQQLNTALIDIAYDYDMPVLSFDQFVALAKKVVVVYNLQHKAKTIPFYRLCKYVNLYISTPFGKKVLADVLIYKVI